MTSLYRRYLFWRLEGLLVDEAGMEAHLEALRRAGKLLPPLEGDLARTRTKIKSLRAKLFPEQECS